MNSIDSDLEEGEILDDSPSSPHLNDKKGRELPRRYVLIENKRVHKHKKRECKNAVRYQAKKLTKCCKKTPNGHHNPLPRTKSHKHHKPLSDRVAKSRPSFSNSLISEIKFSAKGNVRKNSHPGKNSNPEAYFSETKHKTINNDSNFNESNQTSECPHKNVTELKENNKHLEEPVDSANCKESCSSKELNNGVVLIDSDDKNEESEDEEELRRIALATCAKRKPFLENTDSCASLPESENSVQILPSPESNLVADNYEIVDMELDEESGNEVEIIDNESLFVIDTQPSSNIEGSTKNSESGLPLKDESDDEFEADILRAELIGSLFRKRAALEKEEERNNIDVHPERQIPPLVQETYQKPNVDFQPKPLQPTKRIIFRQNGANKHRKMKYNSKIKTSSNEIVEMSPKRLVITVNAESSSEEESDEDENSVPENPVASIEALISDCRQKSDSNEKSNEAKNNEVKPVPKAVSCLSKAQQEEYNNLMKILAEKKKPQKARPPNNETARSPLDDLKLLEEKLFKLEETLKKKKTLMASISKDVKAKNQVYMRSKLRAQHLKEQFLAAEKVRRIKLDEWSKSCHNFDVVKKSVSGLESKITQMHELCSKINASVRGLSCNNLKAKDEQL